MLEKKEKNYGIRKNANRVKGVYVGERDIFMKKFYDPQRIMEIGTTFVRDDGAIFVVLNDNIVKLTNGFQEISKELLTETKSPKIVRDTE